MKKINRAAFGHKGVWGGLESQIARQSKAVANRLCLFAGPVLDEDRAIEHDFGGGAHLVPLDFWKVIIVPHLKGRASTPSLKAFGFILEQETAIEKFGIERARARREFKVGKYQAFQRPIATIGKLTGLVFPDEVLKADTRADADANSRDPIDGLDDLGA